MEDEKKQELDMLCPECGHAFTRFVDRLMGEEKAEKEVSDTACPVCGCGKCKVGK